MKDKLYTIQMRVSKRFLGTEEKSGIVSELFDECIKKSGLYFIEKLNFYVLDKDQIILNDKEATIYMNYRNPFIQNKDKKAIKIMITHNLTRLLFRRDKKLPVFIEDVLVNTHLIKKGYGNDLFYYYYLMLTEYKPARIENIYEFIKINIPWLSFFRLDSYSSDTLKKIASKFKYNREFEKETEEFFSYLKKDLMMIYNMQHAMECYEKIGVKYPDN